MRSTTTVFCLGLLLAAALGCNQQNTAEVDNNASVAPPPREALSLYPLSGPQAVAPLQNQAYGPTNLVATQTYDYADSGQPMTATSVVPVTTVGEPYYTTVPGTAYYAGDPNSQYLSPTLLIPDPPVLVNEPGKPYTVTTVQPAPPYSSVDTVAYTTGTARPVMTTRIPTVPVPLSATAYAPVSSSQSVATYSVTTTSPTTTTYTTTSTSSGSGPTVYYGASTYTTPTSTTAVPTYTTSTYTAPTYSTQTYTTQTYSAPVASAPTYTASAAPVTAAAGGGYRLVPAPDIPPGNHPNDAGPSQWFEILRPDNGPIRIGRVSSTCVCVGVRVPNRHIQAGERALIEARTMTRPPYNNLTYGMYVSVLEPVNQMLDVDVTISL